MDLVPFNPSWADSGSKLDLHAIYQGKPGDDRYVALPVRRHNDWTKKGLRYVTLAHAEDVIKVGTELKARGTDMGALAKSYLNNGAGAFDIGRYVAEQPQRDAAEAHAIKQRLADLEGPKKQGGK